MNRITQILGVLALVALSTANLSCNVNEYCLNCATSGDGGGGDGDGGNGDGGMDDSGDATDGNGCVNTGPEVCDDDDNDCDGNVDEGVLPHVGENCATDSSPLSPPLNMNVGACTGGVKQCVNGTMRCSLPPSPEVCDLIDNDCNNLTDEGDPGGGATCGTNTGECVAGVNRCITGAIDCVGDVGPAPGGEVCNNRDDDCDGTFDEMLTLGACVPGVDGPIEGDTGECNLGTRQCLGGVTTCVGAIFPTFELCDVTNLDQDCNGQSANGYNLNTDPQNCGNCGVVCNLPNAFEGCGPPLGANGTCTILACAPNFFNNDGMVGTGCEFDCGHPFFGNEECNNIDDDCDGLVDGADPDLVQPTGICDDDGACATGTTLTCNGVAGWVCNYTNPNVQKDGMGNIVPETLCDSDIVLGTQADNDCDGRIDEGQPTLAQPCNNGLFGDCRNSGTNVCNTANRTGPAVCQFTMMGPGSSPESCDGKDNNCNNMVDEGASGGMLPGQDWVNIPDTSPVVQIMKYEASQPGAQDPLVPDLTTHVCSKASVQPWTNITYPQAVAACGTIGARLCTEAEWQTMCIQETTYPVAGPATTNTTDFTFIEAEDFFANTPIGPPSQAWTKIAPPTFNGITAMQVPDNGFAENTMANALTLSSRLDYQLNLMGGEQYRAYVRLRVPSPFVGSTAPAVGAAVTSPAATSANDVVVVTTWTAGGTGIPGHTVANGFNSIFSQPHDDGNNDGRLSVAWRLAATAGAQSYTAQTITGTGTTFTGMVVYRAGTIDTAAITSASTNDTGNGAPSPPDAGAGLAFPSIIAAVGGWHFGGSTNTNADPPNNYAEQWQVANSQVGELSWAHNSFAAGTNPDPGQFGDNQTPNGTAAGTIVFPLNSHAVWTGFSQGAAGAATGTISLVAFDQWHWITSTVFTAAAGGGNHTFSLYTRHDGVMIDTIAIARHGTAPTFDNSWAYQNNPRTASPGTCNDDSVDTDLVAAGDQDGILNTGASAMCFANQIGADDAYDMSGNAKEWTQARVAGQNPLRGGASNNEVAGQTCKLNFTLADDTFFFPNVGFRCCR